MNLAQAERWVERRREMQLAAAERVLRRSPAFRTPLVTAERIACAREMRDAGATLATIAWTLGVSESTAKRWSLMDATAPRTRGGRPAKAVSRGDRLRAAEAAKRAQAARDLHATLSAPLAG